MPQASLLSFCSHSWNNQMFCWPLAKACLCYIQHILLRLIINLNSNFNLFGLYTHTLITHTLHQTLDIVFFIPLVNPQGLAILANGIGLDVWNKEMWLLPDGICLPTAWRQLILKLVSDNQRTTQTRRSTPLRRYYNIFKKTLTFMEALAALQQLYVSSCLGGWNSQLSPAW